MAFDYRREYARYRRYFVALRRLYEERPDVRAYLGILLSLVAISFFTLFAIRPTLTTIGSLVSQTDSQRETLNKLQEKTTSLGQAQNLWLTMQDRIPRIQEAVPPEPEPASFLQQVEAVSARSGVFLTTLSVEEVTLFGEDKEKKKTEFEQNLPKDTQGLVFSLTASGSYQALTLFLSDLSSLRRPIVFDTVVFSSPPGSDSITLAISGAVPYLER